MQSQGGSRFLVPVWRVKTHPLSLRQRDNFDFVFLFSPSS